MQIFFPLPNDSARIKYTLFSEICQYDFSFIAPKKIYSKTAAIIVWLKCFVPICSPRQENPM